MTLLSCASSDHHLISHVFKEGAGARCRRSIRRPSRPEHDVKLLSHCRRSSPIPCLPVRVPVPSLTCACFRVCHSLTAAAAALPPVVASHRRHHWAFSFNAAASSRRQPLPPSPRPPPTDCRRLSQPTATIATTCTAGTDQRSPNSPAFTAQLNQNVCRCLL